LAYELPRRVARSLGDSWTSCNRRRKADSERRLHHPGATVPTPNFMQSCATDIDVIASFCRRQVGAVFRHFFVRLSLLSPSLRLPLSSSSVSACLLNLFCVIAANWTARSSTRYVVGKARTHARTRRSTLGSHSPVFPRPRRRYYNVIFTTRLFATVRRASGTSLHGIEPVITAAAAAGSDVTRRAGYGRYRTFIPFLPPEITIADTCPLDRVVV